VRTDQLSEFARQINLGEALFLGHGEEENGGRQRTALLCGAFEALIGALYLGTGLEMVKNFLEPFLVTATDQIISDRRDHDPKSLFQEWVQAQGFGPPIYRTIATNGPEHDKTFEVEVLIDGQVFGRGSGHSKQSAAKEAAHQALDSLGLV
jgi:ribonuclease-3